MRRRNTFSANLLNGYYFTYQSSNPSFVRISFQILVPGNGMYINFSNKYVLRLSLNKKRCGSSPSTTEGSTLRSLND